MYKSCILLTTQGHHLRQGTRGCIVDFSGLSEDVPCVEFFDKSGNTIDVTFVPLNELELIDPV